MLLADAGASARTANGNHEINAVAGASAHGADPWIPAPSRTGPRAMAATGRPLVWLPAAISTATPALNNAAVRVRERDGNASRGAGSVRKTTASPGRIGRTVAACDLRIDRLLAWQQRHRILQSTASKAQAGATFAAAYTARTYEVAAQTLRLAAEYIESENPTPDQLRAYLSEQTHRTSLDDYAILTDAAGNLRMSSDRTDVPRISFADRPWFKATAAAQQPVVGAAIKSRVSNDVLWTLSLPLRDRAGRFVGALAIGVRVVGVQPTARRGPGDPQATAWTPAGHMVAATYVDFQANGEAIAAPQPGLKFVLKPQLVTTGPAILAAAPVPGWGLITAVSYDRAGILDSWRGQALWTVLLLGLLVGVLVWLIARAIGVAARERQDADRLRLLAREVDHRANNLLAVVQASIALTEAPTLAAYKEALFGRIAALGRAHQLLAASRWLGADLTTLVEDELRPYQAQDRGRIKIDGDTILLAPGAAQALAMAIHELATNAAKHGALSRAPGIVSVSWEQPPGGVCHLVWTERGGPSAPAPARPRQRVAASGCRCSSGRSRACAGAVRSSAGTRTG